MAKCSRETHPELFGYLDAYGLDENIINKIDRIKGRNSTAYFVLGWLDEDGHVNMLDLSATPDLWCTDYRDKSSMGKYGWNMLNDSISPAITEKEWNKIKIAEYLEHFIIPGHPVYDER